MFRALFFLAAAVLIICYAAYYIKGDKRYLKLLGQIYKYAFLLGLIGYLSVRLFRIIF